MSINLLSTEILKEIFENIISDSRSCNSVSNLRPCISVSRYWCKTAVPILWRVPILPGEYSPEKTIKLLSRSYLLCLPKDKKEYIKSEGIYFPPAPRKKPPLFDYPAFLRILDFDRISEMAKYWIIHRRTLSKPKIYYMDLLKMTFCELFMERAEMIHFINHSGNGKVPIFDNKAPNFQKLRKIQFIERDNDTTFIENISNVANNLQHIIAQNRNSKISLCTCKALANLIENQGSLQHLGVIGYYQNVSTIIHSVKSQKNSLVKLELSNIDFQYFDSNAFDALAWCIHLKSFEIINCKRTNDTCLRPWPNMFPKLQKFKFNNNIFYDIAFPTNFIIKIIESAGDNLRHIKINSTSPPQENRSRIANAIAGNCKNLQHLSFITLSNSEIFSILDSCQNLKELKFFTENNFDDSIFVEMAKHLPPTLQYWDLAIEANNYYPSCKAVKLFIESIEKNSLKVFHFTSLYFGDPYLECAIKRLLEQKGIMTSFTDANIEPFY
ncbi:15976_t:CDS:1 [Dentiscutata heterogama]|uniref:15976_t:CDS:1 n=1 Tax=Dentiscutata heterogama TaxID=1316150 RepID=A0ACA9LKP0_9GLOM|nr:15976_t:CDS:1 [Dentiscutata heterogama]